MRLRAYFVNGLCLSLSIVSMSCSRPREQPSGGVTLTFWHSFVASTVPSLDELIRDFERANPGIRISAQYIPTGDGLIQKLASAIQSSTAPDISWIHADFLDKLVDAKAIIPMNEFLEGRDSLSKSDLQDIFPPLLSAGTHHGVLYSMPMEATSLALLYNKDLFRAAGLDPDHPPANWQELEEYTRRLTLPVDAENRRAQYGFFVPVFPASGELNIWMILQWTPFLWQAGGREIDADQSHVMFDSPAGVDALALWKRLYDMQDFSKFGLAHDLGFASKKLAMILDGPWNLPRYRAMKGIDWGVAPLPAGPSCRATYLAGEQLVVFRQSSHPREAWQFIKWMLDPETQARFSMRSGYLPVRKSVLDRKDYVAFLSTDPALKAFVEQMAMGRARDPIDRKRIEVNRALAGAIEKATLGKGDPASCLHDAAVEADALLQGTTQ